MDVSAIPNRGQIANEQARAASAMKALADQKEQSKAEALKEIEKSR